MKAHPADRKQHRLGLTGSGRVTNDNCTAKISVAAFSLWWPPREQADVQQRQNAHPARAAATLRFWGAQYLKSGLYALSVSKKLILAFQLTLWIKRREAPGQEATKPSCCEEPQKKTR